MIRYNKDRDKTICEIANALTNELTYNRHSVKLQMTDKAYNDFQLNMREYENRLAEIFPTFDVVIWYDGRRGRGAALSPSVEFKLRTI